MSVYWTYLLHFIMKLSLVMVTVVLFISPLVYKAPYLLVYCESALEVYEVTTGKWVQTIPFRKVVKRTKRGCVSGSGSNTRTIHQISTQFPKAQKDLQQTAWASLMCFSPDMHTG